MTDKNNFVHPYIPNSVPEVKAQMLKEIGIKNIEEIYNEIPEHLRYKGKMNLPEPLVSEYDLKSHVEELLAKNRSCDENISFLGSGCYRHYVPAICDEVNRRSEFLTGYAGEPYEDHGRFQSLFEYQSLMAELLDMDVVNVPTYDWGQAASTSLRMAGRITDRYEVLISGSIFPDRLSIINNYCRGVVEIKTFGYDNLTGLVDIDDLNSKISDKTAAVYFENPSYFGVIETQGEQISEIAHKHGAISVVGVDPLSLGVLSPPSHYGADIICGDIQALGIHPQFGGSLAGFISTRDEEKYIMEYPSRLFGISDTVVEGEWGFGDVTYDRTSFGSREQGKEFIGTATALWGITASVYLSLVGPDGMVQIGKTIMQKTQYAMKKLNEIDGIKIPLSTSAHFKEFIADFNGTGKTVEEINKFLLDNGIFGGKDLTEDFPELGNSALYCITEMHTKKQIDKLVQALKDCLLKS